MDSPLGNPPQLLNPLVKSSYSVNAKSDGLLDDISHPNDEKYAHQRVFVVAIDDYVYLVPYVETEDEIFLKTVIPGRKATKQYFGGNL